MPLQGKYLIDRAGTEYGFNPEMAKDTTTYAVMEGGERVPYGGAPTLPAGLDAKTLVEEDRKAAEDAKRKDREPTEQDKAVARQLLRSYDDEQAAAVAEAGLAAQKAREEGMPEEALARLGSPAYADTTPKPPQPQPPESLAADPLSPSHSINQDAPQDRNQAEMHGYQPSDPEGRASGDTPVMGQADRDEEGAVPAEEPSPPPGEGMVATEEPEPTSSKPKRPPPPPPPAPKK